MSEGTVASYLADNYGVCAKGALCRCLASGQHHGWWCPHWTPVVAKTWEELVEEVRRASRL